MKRIAPLLIVLAIALLGYVAAACLEAGRPVRATVEDESPRPHVARPLRVPTGADGRGETSPARRIGSPQPWNGGPAVAFPLAGDREAARARSLDARARRRAFEGAPPVMPHSAVFGEGSKTCLDCHLEGMRLGSRVAHPASHAALSNCLQCHVESAHRDLPSSPAPVNGFRGRRPVNDRAVPAPGLPPDMPHALLLRTRCLSCHGEFGYEGLRTSHPERAVCVQCHLPEGPGR